MIDFKSALAAGLSMAERIQLNKQEIDDKIEHIANMLYEGTDRSAVLLFTKNKRHAEATFGNEVSDIEVASAQVEGRASRIATIIVNSENGFPVLLDTPQNKFVCKTVEELEMAFSELVRMPYVANTIFSIIKAKSIN